MTTTPHPADALPLPVPFAVFDEFGQGADDRVQDMIRAAHREGYELAMSKRVDIERVAFIRGWDERGSRAGLRGTVDSDKTMNALLDVYFPRDAALKATAGGVA